ncbi:hypothetical protein RMSM_04735 [Rhodopirellula maiorica SM1]|uniref:Uncharacterized protein n=1 Tax=Rhodopirellula maiorica SM1 TaxID=1265738 RepID=M5RSJ3_9BACT|nr:hypothetical protein RMSM_04735 [Rhodopirellula maiorica SM1]
MPESRFRVVSENGSSMASPKSRKLTVHHSEERKERELDRISGAAAPKTVDVSLKQIVPLLIDAEKSNRTWLADFADDTVRIDSDLYDVLLAYQQYRQSEAA